MLLLHKLASVIRLHCITRTHKIYGEAGNPTVTNRTCTPAGGTVRAEADLQNSALPGHARRVCLGIDFADVPILGEEFRSLPPDDGLLKSISPREALPKIPTRLPGRNGLDRPGWSLPICSGRFLKL